MKKTLVIIAFAIGFNMNAQNIEISGTLTAGTLTDGTATLTGGALTGLTSLGINGTITATSFAGALTGNVTGNVSGTAATVTSAAQAAITTMTGLIAAGSTGVNTTFSGPIVASEGLTGALTGNADTATTAGTATTATTATNITAATSTASADVYVTFLDGATGSQGIETSTNLKYKPSTGALTTTSFTGALTGNVTGNVSGTAATVTSAAQAAITTMTGLTAAGATGVNTTFSGPIIANENLTVGGNITVSSDERLKENIVSLGSTISKLLQIDGKSYTMKKDGQKNIGVIAQEVQKVFPRLVNTDVNGMLSVNYQGLVPVLINSVKENNAKIKAQDAKILNLELLVKKLLSKK